jgi:hypothetical protein
VMQGDAKEMLTFLKGGRMRGYIAIMIDRTKIIAFRMQFQRPLKRRERVILHLVIICQSGGMRRQDKAFYAERGTVRP